MTLCTLKTSPRTIHIVRSPLHVVKGGVETFCGRRGLPYEPSWSAYLHCRKCEKAQEESALAGELHGGNLEGIPPMSEPGVREHPGSEPPEVVPGD